MERRGYVNVGLSKGVTFSFKTKLITIVAYGRSEQCYKTLLNSSSIKYSNIKGTEDYRQKIFYIIKIAMKLSAKLSFRPLGMQSPQPSFSSHDPFRLDPRPQLPEWPGVPEGFILIDRRKAP